MTQPTRIAVVTPYCREQPNVLRQCHDSVLAQGAKVTHILVADGHPQAQVDHWQARHIVLPTAHGDYGNVARGIGALEAATGDCEFIAWLDADNWYLPGHLDSLLALHRTSGAPVTTCLRRFYTSQGMRLDTTGPGEDSLRHVDTSCYLLHRPVFDPLLSVWQAIPPPLATLGDRVFRAAMRFHRIEVHSTRQRTVAYRTRHAFHYRNAGVAVPPDAVESGFVAPAVQWLRSAAGRAECEARLGFWPAEFI